MLEKYGNRIYTGEKSRIPETQQRYVTSTYPGSGLRGNYGSEVRAVEKKERTEHPVVPCRPLRSNTGTTSSRSSREPSPEVNGTKASSVRGFARVPNYGPSGSSSKTTYNFSIILCK